MKSNFALLIFSVLCFLICGVSYAEDILIIGTEPLSNEMPLQNDKKKPIKEPLSKSNTKAVVQKDIEAEEFIQKMLLNYATLESYCDELKDYKADYPIRYDGFPSFDDLIDAYENNFKAPNTSQRCYSSDGRHKVKAAHGFITWVDQSTVYRFIDREGLKQSSSFIYSEKPLARSSNLARRNIDGIAGLILEKVMLGSNLLSDLGPNAFGRQPYDYRINRSLSTNDVTVIETTYLAPKRARPYIGRLSISNSELLIQKTENFYAEKLIAYQLLDNIRVNEQLGLTDLSYQVPKKVLRRFYLNQFVTNNPFMVFVIGVFCALILGIGSRRLRETSYSPSVDKNRALRSSMRLAFARYFKALGFGTVFCVGIIGTLSLSPGGHPPGVFIGIGFSMIIAVLFVICAGFLVGYYAPAFFKR